VSVHWYGGKIAEKAERAAKVILRKVANDGVNQIRESMRITPPSDHAGPMRPTSIPGEPPAVQYKNLHNAIAVDDSQLDSKLRIRVGATLAAPYAIYLEVGTDKIEARPWLRPWFDGVRKPTMKLLRNAMK